jgi:uncharacterized protein YbjT (DUF2867 family)
MTTRPRLVLVTGATGAQGGATARHLIEQGVAVRALTRDPAKPAAAALAAAGAQVVAGDLDRPETLPAALGGVDAVFSVQNVVEAGDDGEARQGKALVDAARDAGVGHFVQSSAGGADRHPDLPGYVGKAQVEAHLLASGLRHTVLRPTWFMSDWSWPFFGPDIAAGRLALPLSPDTRLQQIDPRDIGAFAALALLDPQTWSGRAVELAGDDLTVTEIAAALGAAQSRPVAYDQVPWQTWQENMGEFFHGLFRHYQHHPYQADVLGLRREWPALATFDGYLARAA